MTSPGPASTVRPGGTSTPNHALEKRDDHQPHHHAHRDHQEVHRSRDDNPPLNTLTYMHHIYILQHLHGLPLGYEFLPIANGLYSVDATQDLGHAAGREEIEMEMMEDQKAIGVTSIKTPSPLPETQPPLRSYVPNLQKVVRLFGKLTPSQMRIRTLILFLWKTDPPADYEDIQQIIAQVRTLDSHPESTEITAAIMELQANGYVRTITKPTY